MTQREVLAYARFMQTKHNAGMNLKAKVMLEKAIRSLEIDVKEAT